MSKKVIVSTTLLLLIAGFIGFKFGSTPSVKAQSSLPAAPGTWTVWSTPATNVAASATRAAGGTGVKHVATCISVVTYSSDAVYVPLQLRDGASGAGTILMQWNFPFQPNNTGSPISQVCGLNIVGSANTPMTLEFTVGHAYESVDLVGYDAQ